MKNRKSIIECAALCLIAVTIIMCAYAAQWRRADERNVTVTTYPCYITATGECYHTKKCRYANKDMETTVYEAEVDGYRACSICGGALKGWKNEVDITFHDPSAKYPAVGWYIVASIAASVGIIVLFKKRAGVEPA